MAETRSAQHPHDTPGPAPGPSVSASVKQPSGPGHPRVAVITLRGDIDLQAAPDLDTCLSAALERRAHLLLDLTDAQLIDCSCLGLLVRARRITEQHHTVLGLVAPSPLVYRTLRATGLANAFAIFSHRAEALATLATGCGTGTRPFSGRRDSRHERPRPRRTCPPRNGTRP